MPNIHDYLLWRGDIPINSRFDFNKIDSMVLSRFAYLRFDKIELNDNESIEAIAFKMNKLDSNEFLYNGDKELIAYLGKSDRFKNMIVTDFVKNTDKKIDKQFSAITIHISKKQLYVSYIGTDSTINGWKEDFNMSFMDNVPCQVAGKEYLQQIAEKYPNKKIRIGGHSKGGNVAIYSAITVPESIQKRIIKVDNYDGPGFSKEIINKYSNKKIVKKIETFIPQDSIIGRLLNHKEKIFITLSVEKGIYQHDIYSWQLIKDELIQSEKTTDASEIINQAITDWLQTTSVNQRRIFIDSLFELFYSTESETFGDISKALFTNISKILKKYKTISSEDRKTVTSMLRIFVTSYFNVIKERQITKKENSKLKQLIERESINDI